LSVKTKGKLEAQCPPLNSYRVYSSIHCDDGLKELKRAITLFRKHSIQSV
jgi:hypothetical protein